MGGGWTAVFPFADGVVNGLRVGSGSGAKAHGGHAVIEGDDPLALRIIEAGAVAGSALPFGGRYPCGSLSKDGIWYYGTYCLDRFRNPWDVMASFVGFHISRDGGKSWEPSPSTPVKPLFDEGFTPSNIPPARTPFVSLSLEQFRNMPKVKMGSPHFVDFGKNMEHSPDGKAYLLGHGATRSNAICSWISGDRIYLARVIPSPRTINDVNAYEFFAGHNGKGEPVWVKEFSKIKPLLEWNDHLGCVTATWNPVLKRCLMCITNGGKAGYGTFDTLILESEKLAGPWRRVVYMEKFGEEGYFVNIPSKFTSADGRTLWLFYSANYKPGRINPPPSFKSNPPGSRYGLCLQEIRFIGR